MARDRVLFAGDVHLHPARPGTADRFGTFLREVAPDAERLYLLGDLFDHWVSPRQVGIAFYAEMLAAVREVSDAGVAVRITAGNRDFLLDGGALARAGMTRMPLWHEARLGDEFALLTHGDLLCTRDRPYQRMRAMLRLPFIRWLSRGITLRRAASLGERLRGVSRRAVAAKRPEISFLAPEAVRQRFAAGRLDVLVCGHVHRPGEWRATVAGRERRLFVLPEWTEESGGWLEWTPPARWHLHDNR